MKGERKGIKFDSSDENWKKILEADKMLNINSLPSKAKNPPLSFGQYIVGFLFLALIILMIIFEFLPAIRRSLQLFSGK